MRRNLIKYFLAFLFVHILRQVPLNVEHLESILDKLIGIDGVLFSHFGHMETVRTSSKCKKNPQCVPRFEI